MEVELEDQEKAFKKGDCLVGGDTDAKATITAMMPNNQLRVMVKGEFTAGEEVTATRTTKRGASSTIVGAFVAIYQEEDNIGVHDRLQARIERHGQEGACPEG